MVGAGVGSKQKERVGLVGCDAVIITIPCFYVIIRIIGLLNTDAASHFGFRYDACDELRMR
jgi:hypothetical protein